MNEIAELRTLREILDNACNAGRITLKQCRVAPRTKNEKLLLLVALNELIRKCESVLAMLRDDAWAGIGTVSRSGFETYADIRNLLVRGESYVDYMMWMSSEHQRSGLQGFVSYPESDYTKSVEAVTKAKYGKSLSEIIDSTKESMKCLSDGLPEEYKDKNGEVLKGDFHRFRLADLAEEYNVLYRRLSGGVHGRVSDMVDGILAGDKIVWPPEVRPDPPIAAVDCLCVILLDATARICKALGKTDAHVKPIARAHSEVRLGRGADQLRDGVSR